ncbi:MAG TPA: hypothetical protein VJ865_16865 [Gemmatimonadaceae bacterium]|nr:hypothetical protein [Gemmatimonadaceae bacterium]
MIEMLRLLAPDAHRTHRTKALCHERLARQRKQATTNGHLTQTYRIERALVCGFCLIYISAVALVAVQVLGGF